MSDWYDSNDARANPDCPICGGTGYWWDGDGNEVDCADCTAVAQEPTEDDELTDEPPGA
jgi:transcription initiation factor TFIIIB Brf1 subunit/transcription initiation factor TFIIB